MLNMLESWTNFVAQLVHEVLSLNEPHEKINHFYKYRKN